MSSMKDNEVISKSNAKRELKALFGRKRLVFSFGRTYLKNILNNSRFCVHASASTMPFLLQNSRFSSVFS